MLYSLHTGLAISIAVSLPVAGHSDSDYKTIHSDNCTTSKLCNNSISGLVGALFKSFGLSEGSSILVFEYKLASR